MTRQDIRPPTPVSAVVRTDPGQTAEMDLVMISNFGPSEGGRETWAYQFLPRLLERLPNLRIHALGLRMDDEPDNRTTFGDAMGEATPRLTQTLLKGRKSWIPNSILFSALLFNELRGRNEGASVALGVGSVMELLAILVTPAWRNSYKILWLRTIWAQEKSARIPAFLAWAARRFEMALLRRADLLIANGEDTADFYRRLGFKVEVIPNSVDCDRWSIDPPGLETPIRIGFVSRLIDHKSFREFLRAAAELHGDQRMDFVVVGGPSNDAVAEAARLGIVTYRPAVPNHRVGEVLSTLDVCATLAKFGAGGGVSNALLEQMAAGRVIVAWDNPIYRQVLTDDCAYFVPQGSVEGLVSAFRAIADDPDAAAAKGAAARERSRTYNWEGHLDRFIGLTERHLTPGLSAGEQAS